MPKVKPIPEGHNHVSPYLIVNGAARALDFYTQAFGAKELMRHTAPDGKVGHGEVRIGGHTWDLSSHSEDVSMEELDRRVAAMMGRKA